MLRQAFLLILFLGGVSCTTPPRQTAVLIDIILYDGFELANADEIVVLRNISTDSVDVGGWRITDGESGTAVIPPRTVMAPDSTLWLTKNGTITSQRFRKVADFELEDSHPLVNNLLGTWPTLSDEGDVIQLLDDEERLIDVVVYKVNNQSTSQWQGAPIQPSYTIEEGIFLQRVRGLDTNTAEDWRGTAVVLEEDKQIGSPLINSAELEKSSP